jgi:hypothetical protein
LQRDREEQSKRWEEQSKRWEEQSKRWEEQSKKWDEEIKKWDEQSKKWDEQSKRWEEQSKKWDEQSKKWDEQSKRWDEQSKKWDEQSKKWDEQSKKWDEENKKWKEQNQKWDEENKKWHEQNQKNNELLAEIKRMNKKHDTMLGALGARWGLRTEASFRNALRAILKDSFGVQIVNINDYDSTGEVFGIPDQVEIDIIIRNGTTIACEIKSSISKSDVATFEKKVLFYQKQYGRTVNRKIIISPMVDSKAIPVAERLRIEVYSYAEEVLVEVESL